MTADELRSLVPVDVDWDHLTLDSLIDSIQKVRGRELVIVELGELTGADNALCGVWIGTPTKDLILHAPSSSELHRQQFILHELAHILLQHAGTTTGARPSLPERVEVECLEARVLHRDCLDNAQEVEAERLADVLASHLRRSRWSTPFADVFA